jgi:hypothetical protein
LKKLLFFGLLVGAGAVTYKELWPGLHRYLKIRSM